MSHRLGYLRSGYDADVVVWDSMPLALGATPVQVYIDGIAQLENPVTVVKPEELQKVVSAPDVKAKVKEVLKYRGEPPLEPVKSVKNVVFSGVESLYLRDESGTSIEEVRLVQFGSSSLKDSQRVIIEDGQITCTGADCAIAQDLEFDFVDLKGGSITAGLSTYGSYLGLMEIRQESSTTDGKILDVLDDSSALLDGLAVKGSDGARFGGRDQLIAYANGVTTEIAHPIGGGVFNGLSYASLTNGKTPLDGISQAVTAMHITLGSVSTLALC